VALGEQLTTQQPATGELSVLLWCGCFTVPACAICGNRPTVNHVTLDDFHRTAALPHGVAARSMATRPDRRLPSAVAAGFGTYENYAEFASKAVVLLRVSRATAHTRRKHEDGMLCTILFANLNGYGGSRRLPTIATARKAPRWS
jgi:hypothetical protein